MKKLMLIFCLPVIISGGKLFYEVAGKGENIILLHDGMVNHRIENIL